MNFTTFVNVENEIIMLENYSPNQNCNCGERSATILGKLSKVFGRKKTYRVQRVQQLNEITSTELCKVYNILTWGITFKIFYC